MKISALLEGRKRLVEGGNLSINGHEAQHLDLKVTKRSYMVPKLNELLYAINSAYYKMYKESLWSNEVLASGKFLSGSSLHFFNVKGISDEVFTEKKPTVGDIDTMVDKTKEPNLQQFLTAYTNKQIGAAVFLGFQRGNEQFSGLFELQDPPVKVQIDFEFVEFEKDNPTDWARFSHSSSWEDLQAGVKGVFHKWLIQGLTALTRKDFLLRKLDGRGKKRVEKDFPTTDNMYSFAVSSKEGGGLRAKYEPVLDDNGKPLVKDGLPVMAAAPTSGYERNIGQIFSNILGHRLNPKQAQKLQNQFWSFTGLLQVMNSLMTPEEKEQVMQGFLKKTIGKGAQGMYKNNPDKDIAEKTLAINTLLNTLKLPKPADLDQLIDAYRKSYKYSEAGTDEKATADAGVVKAMAKNTLAEAVPSYKRKGIQHIYNPGSSTEMKDADFINFCKEIAHDGGNFASVPINLKVDGAGIRFGKTQNDEPFFMTSRVETPMTKANIGDFEKYGRSQGQSDEQLARTQNYDKALSTIVNADFMKDIPPDTIVQAEMLFNPMAQQDSGGYKFVNIPYDPKKLGKVMTLVPISIKQYSTGEQSPDAAEIKEALIKDSTPNIKMVNNTLSHKGINVSKIVNPIVKNSEALLNAVSQRGDSPDKQKAKAILSAARQALSKSIINSPIPGKDQLGDMIEGLVINMPSGTLAKVTSPDMQQKMADKQAMNKKPTEGSNRTKPAVVTIGSFVGHRGHEQLINQTIETADRVGGDPYIYVSPVVGPDDPIPPADKVKTLQKLYPQYAKNIQVWNPQGTPVKKIEKELVLPANSPYNKIILLVGDDRYEGFKNWMDSLEKRMKDPAAIAKYGGTQNQVDFETIRTERDPSKGGTGISFTQLRDKLKEPNTNEQDKLKFWMQAFDTDKLGADWIKHLMDTTAKNMGIQQQAIKEYIQKIKPMLEYATPTQKVKIYNQLAEAKQKLSEMGEPSSNNLANVVAKLINSKKPEIFSRYGDKKVMDTIIDTCTNNVGKTEMELAVEAMTKLKHLAESELDRFKKYTRPVVKTEPKIERTTNPAGRTTDHVEWIVTSDTGERRRFTSKRAAQEYYAMCTNQSVAEAGITGSSRSADAIAKQKEWQSSSASDSKQDTKTFSYQGYTINFTPDTLNIYLGGDLVLSRKGNFAQPTKKQLVAARLSIGKIIDDKRREALIHSVIQKNKGRQGVAEGLDDGASATPAKNERGRFTAWDDDEPMRLKCEDGEFRTIQEINMLRQKIGMKPFSIKSQQGVVENNTAAGINKMFNNLGDPVFSNLQRVALLAMQGRQQEAYGRLQSVIKDASPQVQKKIIDAVNNIKPVTINGKIADSSTLDKSKQHQDWIINTFIPWVQSLLGKQGVAEKMKMGATIEPMEDKEQSDPVVDATIKFYKPVMQKASEQEVDHYAEKARHLLQKTDDPAVRKKLIDIFKEGKHNPYLQGGIITAIAALLGGGAINLANNIQLTPYQTNLMMQGILNSIVPAVGARMSGKNWVDTLKYTLASLGVGVGIATVMEKESDVIGHVAKDLTGKGAPIAKLRAARDLEQMRKRERSDGLPVEPKFDYLDEK